MCKIIHTDLKPENVSMSLSKADLQEIAKRGQISNINKTVKTQDMTNSNMLGGKKAEDKSTTEMTKNQKKKLKQKLKKEQIKQKQEEEQLEESPKPHH